MLTHFDTLSQTLPEFNSCPTTTVVRFCSFAWWWSKVGTGLRRAGKRGRWHTGHGSRVLLGLVGHVVRLDNPKDEFNSRRPTEPKSWPPGLQMAAVTHICKCSDPKALECPSSHIYPGLFSSLVLQMEAGFQRRKDDFICKAFNKYKCDTGGIPKEALAQALKEIGMALCPDDQKEMLYTQEVGDSGCIKLDEFRLIVTKPGKVGEWASNLHLAKLLADCMPLSSGEDALRTISNLPSAEIKLVVECFGLGLTRLLEEEIGKLKHAYEVMDRSSKAVNSGDVATKFEVIKMSCGNIEDFLSGLSGRIGDPFLDFEKAMEAEHCLGEESTNRFTTRNYGIETTPYNEWNIIVNGKHDLADKRCGRKDRDINELMQSKPAVDAKLRREEIIAIVMYTGPMFERYNYALRQAGSGYTYTTTIHVLVSAIQKVASLAKIPDGLKLYRGLGGVTHLPQSFFKPHSNGGRGYTGNNKSQ